MKKKRFAALIIILCAVLFSVPAHAADCRGTHGSSSTTVTSSAGVTYTINYTSSCQYYNTIYRFWPDTIKITTNKGAAPSGTIKVKASRSKGGTGEDTLYLQTWPKDDDCTKAYSQTFTCTLYDRHDWGVSRAAEPAHNWEEWSTVPSGKHSRACQHPTCAVSESCDGSWGAWVSNGDGTHTRTCSKDSDHVETRSCYGGTATCQRKAVCTACGEEYGDYSAHNYGTLVPLQDAVHTPSVLKPRVEAHYQCSVCRKYFTEAYVETTLADLTGVTPAHSFGDFVKTDPVQHWKICSCGLKSETGDHVYDDDSDAICDTCLHERRQYTIALNANGGTCDSSSLTTELTGYLSALPDATRDRHSFDGWFTADGTKVTLTTFFTGDITLTARWTYIPILPVIQSPTRDKTLTVRIGETPTLKVKAQNATAYQWYVDRGDGLDFVPLNGYAPELTLETAELAQNGYRYYCKLSTEDGSVDSPIFTLRVTERPVAPQTGDTATIGLWLAMLLMSVMGIFALLRNRKGKYTA